MKNPFSYLFRARDKPQNAVSAAPSFYFGMSGSGKSVSPSSAIQVSAVYACVRVIAETIASLPFHVYEATDEGSRKNLSIGEALDVMIRWFCLLFGNQFTPDDVLDYYPVDRMMHDIALALMAVQTQTTEILDEFPTKAAKTEEAATLQP